MKPRTIALIIAGWTLLALLFAAQLRIDASYSGRTLSMPQALVLSFAGWYGWALLSPLIIILARRLGTRGPRLALHIPSALLLTFVKVAVTTEILRRAGFSPRSTFSIANMPLNLVTYAAIVAATHGIDTWRRGREANGLLMQARVDLLTSQLQPHFLFNALHSIAELMHTDVDAADRALTRVSELLRATLDAGKHQEIRLADEIELVQRYLNIEQIRLGDRLRTRFEVDPATRDSLVPMFILQPIVENAVRHAVAPRTAPGTIAISARREVDELQIEIADDGGGFAASSVEGVGLTNTRARLAHLYGDKQRVEIASGAAGASVRLVLPFRT